MRSKSYPLLFLRLFSYITFASLTLAGCGNLFYLSKLGWHQSYITFHSIPVQEVLENEGVENEAKEKIHFIQEVKRYGEEKLGLKRTKSYSKYFEIKGPVLHIITASEKDCLQLYHWDFPITGKVTYKSFFTKEEVLKEKRFLEKRSYDTFVQKVEAYSTLGWLKDPIFSSMLQWDEVTLANLILHEMTHATFYFKGQTNFNERIATFIGNQGAVDFLIEKYGKGSNQVVEAIHIQEDGLLFSQWIDQACQQLSSFYGRKISKNEKLKARGEVFQSIKGEFMDMQGRFKTNCYKDFYKLDINNAVLLAYRRYIHQLDKFKILYDQLGQDLKKVVEYFKMIKALADKSALKSFIE